MKLRQFLIVIPFTLFGLSACQNGYRKPSSASGEINLKSETEYILKDVQNPSKFKLETCADYVGDVYNDVMGLQPTRFDIEKAKTEWKEIYKNLWDIRLKLRERYVEFYTQLVTQGTHAGKSPQEIAQNPDLISCSQKLRDGFRLSRWVEDYLAENFSGEPQDFKAGDPKNLADKKFVPTPLRGEAPWFLKAPKYENSELKIRSGDLITSRGNAYTSSAIARIADVDSQFSHLAFIYIKDSDKGQEYTIEEALKLKDPSAKFFKDRALVIEAHIEVGSTIRPLSEYLADGNARNMVFRYHDYQIAHRAAKYTFDYIEGYRKRSFDSNPIQSERDVDHNVPYNFLMNLENPKAPGKMFCSQVAHIGFFSQNVSIPLYQSRMNTNLSLVKRMGIKPKKGSQTSFVDMYAPGDMEVDPRFEVLGEYRNIRKLKGLRMKDMELSAMYRMMDQGYEFTPPISLGIKAIAAWTLRQMEMKQDKLPKNMNTKILGTIFSLEHVATYFEKELDAEEERYKKTSGGMGLSFVQGLEYLEKLKDRDRELFFSGKKPNFHWHFSHPQDRAEKQKRDLRKTGL